MKKAQHNATVHLMQFQIIKYRAHYIYVRCDGPLPRAIFNKGDLSQKYYLVAILVLSSVSIRACLQYKKES